MDDVAEKRAWLKAEREKRGWGAGELAKRAQPIADRAGYDVRFNQQLIWNFETGAKKVPGWYRFAVAALRMMDDDDADESRIANEDEDIDAVLIEKLPTFVGAGGGGTGEGDPKSIVISRGLVEALRIPAEELLAIDVEGDSMEPKFLPGDQLLIDRRKKNTAQPGAFCLWDGDGYVVKFIERVPGSQPAQVRVISDNARYREQTRLVDEIEIMGRVVWFGRRV
jgi:phage repressor protein C with HTH and peptisase S24 domain